MNTNSYFGVYSITVIITVFLVALIVFAQLFGWLPVVIVAPDVEITIAPLVIGCASLIVTLGSRNTSISDRIRSNVKLLEERQGATTSQDIERKKNLKAQLDIFWERYTLNQLALGFQFIALALFVMMAIFDASSMGSRKDTTFWLGVGFLFLGLVFTLTDIYRAHASLRLEKSYAETFFP
jgi:hypothetical protein